MDAKYYITLDKVPPLFKPRLESKKRNPNMTLFQKQCRKLIFLPSIVLYFGTAKGSKPIFSTKRNHFFFKSMRNAALKIVAFRK